MNAFGGRVSVRRQYYSYRPYDKVLIDGTWHTVKGVQNNGTYITLQDCKPVAVRYDKRSNTAGHGEQLDVAIISYTKYMSLPAYNS